MAKSKCKTVYEFHPLASHYELLDGKEAEELKASIQAIGPQVPAVLYEGMILDGRNRWIICEELGIECPTTIYEGDEPELFVEAMNGHRRHLSDNAKLLAAVALATARNERLAADSEKEPKNSSAPNGRTENPRGDTVLPRADVDRIAEETGAGARTVQRAAKIVADATPEVIEAVKDGDVSIRAGEEIAALPKSKQADALLKEQLHDEVIAAWKSGELTRAQCKKLSEVRPMLQRDELKKLREAGKTKAPKAEEAEEPEDDAPEETISDVIKRVNGEIESFCKRITALADECPQDDWLDDMNKREGFLRKVKDACATLRSAKCSAPCPKCEGEGCRKCHNTGRLPKYYLDQIGGAA